MTIEQSKRLAELDVLLPVFQRIVLNDPAMQDLVANFMVDAIDLVMENKKP